VPAGQGGVGSPSLDDVRLRLTAEQRQGYRGYTDDSFWRTGSTHLETTLSVDVGRLADPGPMGAMLKKISPTGRANQSERHRISKILVHGSPGSKSVTTKSRQPKKAPRVFVNRRSSRRINESDSLKWAEEVKERRSSYAGQHPAFLGPSFSGWSIHKLSRNGGMGQNTGLSDCDMDFKSDSCRGKGNNWNR